MKKILFLLISLFFISCDKFENYNEYEGNNNTFDIKRYKNFIIVEKYIESWSDRDYYSIKNDSILINIIVPTSFSKIYSIGDTIK